MKRCPKIRTAGRQKSFREEFFNSPLGAPGKTSMAPKVNSLPSRLKPGPWNLLSNIMLTPAKGWRMLEKIPWEGEFTFRSDS